MVKTIVFVTGNEKKLREAKQILSNEKIIGKKFELPEIQGERHEIIKEKARIAANKLKKPCFVDDTSLCFNALNGLPGQYVKHFLGKLGRKNLVKLLDGFKDKSAKAIVMIGYCEPNKGPVYFEGVVDGKIVMPKGKTNFGWDPIFVPDGFKKTFAQMSKDEKNRISHRYKALLKLKKYLGGKRK